MKLYYSNIGSINFEKNEVPGIGVLESYYGMKKINIPDWADSYFLDSGAYSAWRKKENILLNKYIDFVGENKKNIGVYASLDVIFDARQSLKNYLEMLKAGLDPLPTFHRGSDIKYLYKYADKTDYIAIGGLAMANAKSRVSFLNQIFSDFPDPSKIGFHGFGLMDEKLLSQYPWRTADASSIHMRARYGSIKTCFNKWLYINPNVSGNRLAEQTSGKLNVLREWVESIGCDWEKARGRDSDGIKERCKISIFHYENVAAQTPVKYISHVGKLL